LNSKRSISWLLALAAVFIQIAFILSIQVRKEWSLRSGKKITVKIVPVDPRSVFRGDYIILNYEFSRLSLGKIMHDKAGLRRGQRVFVTIAKTNGEWQAVAASSEHPGKAGTDEIILRGSVTGWPSGNSTEVNYGIESYFVPEGKGKQIEKDIARRMITAELSVDKKGYASVCKILIDGREIDFR